MDASRFKQLLDGIKSTEFSEKQLESLIDAVLQKSKTGPTGNPVYEAYFDSIRASKGMTKQVPSTGQEDWRIWANNNKITESLIDTEKLVSYYVYNIGGFSPSMYTKQAWIKAIRELIQASGDNLDFVRQGIEKGQVERVSNNLTFSGPHSFTSYVRSVASMEFLMERGSVVPEQVEQEIWA